LATSKYGFSPIEIIDIFTLLEDLLKKIHRHHAVFFFDDTIKITHKIILDSFQFFEGKSFVHRLDEEINIRIRLPKADKLMINVRIRSR